MVAKKQKAIYFPYEGNHFSGVFRGYNKIVSSFKAFVKIDATSSVKSNTYDVMYPFNTTSVESVSWFSDDKQNSFISMKFINHKMSLLSYSLRSRSNCPVSWNVEAMNNAGNWEIVSCITNDRSLKNNAFGHWNSTNNNFYSTFRIRQTGKRERNDGITDDCFELSVIEFFGTLLKTGMCSCKCKHSMNLLIAALTLVVCS